MANEFIIKRGFQSKGNSEITGSLSATGNLKATGTIIGSNISGTISGTNTGDQDLSALALKTSITGSFTAPSASLSSRTTTLESNAVFTSAMISGSFRAPSASFSTRVTSNELGSSQNTSNISSNLTKINSLASVTSSYALTSSISGSFESTGSFAVGNLLDLLANYGQTGIPTGSGEGGVSVGDINLDGQVNVTDLLLLLAGYGNPNIICNDLIIPPNTNYQLNGPKITVSQSISVTVGTNYMYNRIQTHYEHTISK